jgi:hypothetical protein
MFEKENIFQLSKDSMFVQRQRKVTAISLLESVLYSDNDPSKVSLNDMAIYHRINYGLMLTRQALAKRFDKNATNFLKKLLGHLLESNLSESASIFTNSKFKRITIKDSTSNQLPENLKSTYPGSGGSGSKSSVRIQFEYDLKNLEVLELSVSAFNNQDKKNAKDTLDNIKRNDLVIRDLGYITFDILEEIGKRKAWYLSRLNPVTKVTDQATGTILDFVLIEEYMKHNGLCSIEKNVFIGAKRLPVRLVIELVPDKIKEERLRKALKEGKKKGRVMSKEKRARLGLNLFLTNCPEQMLAASELRKIYGIRWQIELIFKAWKQTSGFHKIKKMNVDRFEFLLYAKLVLLMLHWKIYQAIDILTYHKIRLRVSVIKIYKTLKQFSGHIKDIIRGNDYLIGELVACLIDLSYSHLSHSDRKNRINWRNVENI